MKLFHQRHFPYVLLPQQKTSPPDSRRPASVVTVLLYFWLAYLCAVAITWLTCQGNPTSWFFNPDVGYQDDYSIQRRQQADALINEVESSNVSYVGKFGEAYSRSAICVGVPTIARHGSRYFRTTLGSLLEGMDPRERRHIYLMPFIAQSNPDDHPAYQEAWLPQLADRVLTYDNDVDIERLRELEQAIEGHREKALFDYAYMMKACLNTSLPYIAIIEDDVLAMDGWFHRTMKALSSFETEQEAQNVYLRMFYTEQFLGWNTEDWPAYFMSSLLSLIALFAMLIAVRRCAPATGSYLSNQLIGIYCGVFLPLCILLFFASGRVSISTWRPRPYGIREMPNYGCCAQGLIFSRELAERLVPYYEMKKLGFADDLTEQYADATGLRKYAIVPSVLQHVGRKTSKGDDGAEGKMSVAETIRSFAFEKYDSVELERVHLNQLALEYWGGFI